MKPGSDSSDSGETPHPRLSRTCVLELGGFSPAVDTTLRVDSSTGAGSVVSLEDDLNLPDRRTLPFALFNARLGESWRVEAEYFSLGRDNTFGIARDLTIRDQVFRVATTVRTEFDTDVYRLGFGYSFFKDRETEIGAALGVHVTTFDLSVVGATGAISVQADTVAPLPTIGLYGFHAFSSEWMLLGRADLFALDVGDYSGSMLNINLAAEYQIVEQVGVGVGYRYVDLNLTSNKTIAVTGTDFRGEFDYQLSGPKLYVTVGF